jgi:hypothetical protein
VCVCEGCLTCVVDGVSDFAVKRKIQVLSESNQRIDSQNREFGFRRLESGSAIGWLFNMEPV